MATAKKWILSKHFDGMPMQDNFKLEEEKVDTDLKENEFLCEAEFLSVDPYMRLFGNSLPEGATMMGEQVARVTDSKNPDYPAGSYVCIKSGWRTLTKYTGSPDVELRPLPDVGELPRSLALGCLGMTGETAYFGFEDICSPKEGDVVFINGAAGAVGSVVGQLAKAKGCTVIGCAGTEEKLTYLKGLGFDHVFNYKSRDLDEALKELAPDGIDIFYDNVGGESSSVVYDHMKMQGRVALGGVMAGYNDKGKPGAQQKGLLPYTAILMKQLRIEGFHLWRFYDKRNEADAAIKKLIDEGKIKYHEVVVSGFEKMPEAFIDQLKGKSQGKLVIKA